MFMLLQLCERKTNPQTEFDKESLTNSGARR